MKPLLLIAALLGLSNFGLAQNLSGVNGDCTIGGQQVLTQGLPSTGTQQIGTASVLANAGVMASFPNCLVTVYYTGTTNKASIFSNNLAFPMPLSNPFTANIDGSFIFFATRGACYDITLNTGIGPGLPYPRTYTDVCFAPLTGGGGGGGPALQVNGTPNLSQSLLNLTGGQSINPVDEGGGEVLFKLPVSNFLSNFCMVYAQGDGTDDSLGCSGAFYDGGANAIKSNFETGAGQSYSWTGGGNIKAQVVPGSPSVQWSTESGVLLDNVTAPLVADGGGNISCPSCGTSTGVGNPTLDNCTPDQTGNSYYSVVFINYYFAHWEFVTNTTTFINCTVFVPAAQTGATLILDIASADATAGHTASFQTCDGIVNTGQISITPNNCAVAQTYTTTSTAYQRVTLTFNVQSTLVNNGILTVKIGMTPAGTQPAANLLVYPHFVL